MKNRLFSTLSLLFCFSASDAFAWNSNETQAIHEAEKYLTNIHTIVADFMQVAPNGELSNGKFYLSRPGKMRWQYEPPTPILMLANGHDIIYYDYELDQVSHIPMESTLAGFLTRDIIKFSDDVKVTNVSNESGVLRISLIQTEKPDNGKLTLEFTTLPMQLRNMKVIDATGQETTVSLNNAQFDVPLDKQLFVFKERTKAGSGKKIIR